MVGMASRPGICQAGCAAHIMSAPLRPLDWSLPFGDPVAQLSWSPDGTRLGAGGVDGRAAILDASDGRVLQGFIAHEGGLFRAAFSPARCAHAAGPWPATTQQANTPQYANRVKKCPLNSNRGQMVI